MKIVINCYGTLATASQKELQLQVGESVDFDFLNNKIIVTIDSVSNEYFSVSLSRKFCYELNGKIDLLDADTTFKLPYFEESILALPLFDGSYKLKFVTAEEKV